MPVAISWVPDEMVGIQYLPLRTLVKSENRKSRIGRKERIVGAFDAYGFAAELQNVFYLVTNGKTAQ